MDLVHKIVKSNGKYYHVDSVDLEGFLVSRELSELCKSGCKSLRLDPLTSNVESCGWKCLGYEEFSSLELDFIRRIDGYVDLSDIHLVVGYYGKTGRYLLAIFTHSKKIHILDISGSSVYGIVMDDGKIDLSTGMFDLHDVRSSIVDEYENVEWVRYAKLYRMSYKPTSDVLETLGRLFYGYSRCEKVILPILKEVDGGVLLKLSFNGKNIIINRDTIGEYLYKTTTISRSILNDYMERNFSHPCPCFEGDELEKVIHILKLHGYEFLIEDFKSGNGIVSNYAVDSREDYLCIRDSSLKSAYSLHLLRVVPVKSYAGGVMYYELRLYPLCESGRYLVVYSSIYREKCEELLKYKNANLIRGNLLRFKGFPFEVTAISDSGEEVYIRYTIRGNKDIYHATYNKVSCTLSDIEFSDTGKDREFIDVLLRVFDKKADLLKVPNTEFYVYRANGRKFILNARHCIGIEKSLDECLSLVKSMNTGQEYLIVSRKNGKEVGNWIFNQSDNSLTNV